MERESITCRECGSATRWSPTRRRLYCPECERVAVNRQAHENHIAMAHRIASRL